jgi:hypothetical protein
MTIALFAKIIATILLVPVTFHAALSANERGVWNAPANGWSGLVLLLAGVIVGATIWST